MKSARSRYHGHRFPPEIIGYAVWIYHRFCLSFRDVEDLLAERGIIVSYERGARVGGTNGKRPGKRTDFHECQWIQHLHSMGLLHAAFRPAGDVCAVRSLMRHRNDLVGMASQHMQHMHKALTQMNLQIQHVISDLTGLTGLAILDAIVAGERHATVLAQLRDPRIKASEETIRKSLEGNWRTEHVLALKQRLSLYRTYLEQIHDCDREIEKRVAAFDPRVDPEERPLPEDRKAEAAAAQEEDWQSGFQYANRGLQVIRC